MAEQQQVQPRRGREGGRWINERPTSAEFGAWFHENMKIDPALAADDYVGGVVLIPAVDTKAKMVTGFRNGKPIIEEGEELSYIPYAKVETRINYFWDLMSAHREWVAFIEGVRLNRIPLEVQPAIQVVEEDGKKTTTTRPGRPDALTSLVHQLPVGFSIASVPVGQGFTHFLCCTTRVEVYDREQLDKAIERCASPSMAVKPHELMAVARSMCAPIRRGEGIKQVPMVKGRQSLYADDSSVMKAETGSLGRALGFAGIFVIPGSGVATAEDMQEALSQSATPPQEAPGAGNQGPSTPEVTPARTGAEQAEDEEGELKVRAAALWKKLGKDHPAKATEFGEWAQDRKLHSLTDARGAMLRGVVKKLETMLDEAERAAQQAPLPIEGGESDGDAATPSASKPSGEAS